MKQQKLIVVIMFVY